MAMKAGEIGDLILLQAGDLRLISGRFFCTQEGIYQREADGYIVKCEFEQLLTTEQTEKSADSGRAPQTMMNLMSQEGTIEESASSIKNLQQQPQTQPAV